MNLADKKAQTQRAKRNVIADGQGPRRRKPNHRKTGSKRHLRMFRDLRRKTRKRRPVPAGEEGNE